MILKKSRKNKGKSLEENVDKIVLRKFIKTSSLIDFYGKYIWAISNINIDTTKDIMLIDIKNY